MIRTAGTIDRAVELVAAALTWGHDCTVTVVRPKGTGRPTYAVSTTPGPEDAVERTTAPDAEPV
jgi:hypothetical protein